MAARLLELRVQIPPGAWMFVLCVVSKDKKAKCRAIKTKKQVRSTREYKNNLTEGRGCLRCGFRGISDKRTEDVKIYDG